MKQLETRPVCLTCKGLAGVAGEAEPDYPAILVEEGRIRALGREALTAGALRHDMPDFWLSPAPLDAHVHLWLGGDPAQNLRAAWESGLAAVRDLGHPPAKPTPRGSDLAPLVIGSGPGICARGEAKSWLAQQAAGADGFAGIAQARVDAGAGVLKVFATGLLDFDNPGQVEHPQAVDLAEMEAVAQVASRAGLGMSVHASGEAASRAVIQAGAASLEHGFFMGPQVLELLATSRTAWVPTLAAVLAHALDPQGRHDDKTRSNLRQIANSQMQAMRLAEELGVDMVLGTDAGSYGLPHGRAVGLEMQAWLDAGLKPATVYQAVTLRAARLMGLGGELGAIQKGARAWLAATRQDPRQNPMSLLKPAWRSY